MDESDEEEKTIYIQKGKYSCKINVEEPTSDFQFKVSRYSICFCNTLDGHKINSYLDWNGGVKVKETCSHDKRIKAIGGEYQSNLYLKGNTHKNSLFTDISQIKF